MYCIHVIGDWTLQEIHLSFLELENKQRKIEQSCFLIEKAWIMIALSFFYRINNRINVIYKIKNER